MGLGEPVSVARVRPVRNRGLLENHFPSEAVCLILTLTQLDYKSSFEKNVKNTTIQKITAEKEK